MDAVKSLGGAPARPFLPLPEGESAEGGRGWELNLKVLYAHPSPGAKRHPLPQGARVKTGAASRRRGLIKPPRNFVAVPLAKGDKIVGKRLVIVYE